MYKINKRLVVVFAFAFGFILAISSIAQASVIYWGLPPMYSSFPGNMALNNYNYMIARGSGAYAYTDYSNAWGLNNLAQAGSMLGLTDMGMGMAGLNLYANWGQTYPMAPMFGYSSGYFGNPWLNFPATNYALDYALAYSMSMQPYSYYPFTDYSLGLYNFNLPDYSSLLNLWGQTTTTGTDSPDTTDEPVAAE